MDFGDVNAAAGLQALDGHLADKSYIGGYVPTQADVVVLKALKSAPVGDCSNALRWFKHISSFADEAAAFPPAPFDTSKLIAGSSAALTKTAPAKAAPDEEDDDFDMFASDEEEEVDEEAEKIKQAKLAAYAEKKSKKPALIAKSNVILDVKPWDDETDLGAMEACIRTIEMEGLLWGTATKKPVAYGIFKVTICAVVEDDKVSVDWLEEKILEFEDFVQSVDIAAFQKI